MRGGKVRGLVVAVLALGCGVARADVCPKGSTQPVSCHYVMPNADLLGEPSGLWFLSLLGLALARLRRASG